MCMKKTKLRLSNPGKPDILLKKRSESMKSIQIKMDNVKENPEKGLEAAIEVLRRIGHKRGWS